MTVERSKVTGAYHVSDIVRGYLVTRRYYGYTKREAMRLFREETKVTKLSENIENTRPVTM